MLQDPQICSIHRGVLFYFCPGALAVAPSFVAVMFEAAVDFVEGGAAGLEDLEVVVEEELAALAAARLAALLLGPADGDEEPTALLTAPAVALPLTAEEGLDERVFLIGVGIVLAGSWSVFKPPEAVVFSFLVPLVEVAASALLSPSSSKSSSEPSS